jgi:Rrf2 family protein
MAHLGNSVEYGLHCLIWLTRPLGQPVSSRDLAELQGVSPSFLAKIFQKLEKAGIVAGSEGLRGGYRLARAPDAITVLDVVDAIEGAKPLFDCQEIRANCAVFGGRQPSWSGDGVCAIHAVMIRAEKSMRAELAKTTLADIAATVGRKAPKEFGEAVQGWLSARTRGRRRSDGEEATGPPDLATGRRPQQP